MDKGEIMVKESTVEKGLLLENEAADIYRNQKYSFKSPIHRVSPKYHRHAFAYLSS